MPAGDLYVRIGSTEYGPQGGNVLKGFSLEPSGPFQRGTCTITLAKKGGIFTLVNKQHVQVYVNIGAAYRALFGGVVDDISQNQVQVSDGTQYVTYTIQCVDYNFLLDELVQLAGGQITSNGNTFANHVLRITSYVSTLGYSAPTFDISGVALAGQNTSYSVGSGFRDIAWADTDGKSLREMLQIECDHYQQDIDPSSRPRFCFTPPTSGVTSVGWTTSAALLNIFDGNLGNIAPNPSYHFHDGSGAGLTLFQVQAWGRKLNSPKQKTRVDAKGVINGAGYIYSTLADSTTRATYPNPWDARVYLSVLQNAWNAPVIDLGAVSTTAQIQAAADKLVNASKYPRETVPFTVQNNSIDPAEMMPGKNIRITWTSAGLSGVDYQIAAVRITAVRDNTAGYMSLVYSVQAGLKILELGERGDDATVAPVVGYHVTPRSPTALTRDRDWYGGPPSYVDFHYTPSVTPGCVNFFTVQQGTRTYYTPDYSSTQTTLTVAVEPGVAYTITGYARDQFGNVSLGSTALTGTAAPYPPFDRTQNPDFAIGSSSNATKPALWTETATGTGGGVLVTNPTKPKVLTALKMTCGAGGAAGTDTWRSEKIRCLSLDNALGTQFQLAARVTYYSLTGKGTFTAGIEYYDETDALLSTLYLANGVTPPTDSTKTLTMTTVTPLSAKYARLMTAFVMPSGQVARDLWVTGCVLEEAGVAPLVTNVSYAPTPATPAGGDVMLDLTYTPGTYSTGRPVSTTLYGNEGVEIDLGDTVDSDPVIYQGERQPVPAGNTGSFEAFMTAVLQFTNHHGTVQIWMAQGNLSVVYADVLLWQADGTETLGQGFRVYGHAIPNVLATWMSVYVAAYSDGTANVVQVADLRLVPSINSQELRTGAQAAGTYELVTTDRAGLVVGAESYLLWNDDLIVFNNDLVTVKV